MRVSQERHPPDHSTKEAHRDSSNVAAIICAYYAVVLFSLRLSHNTLHVDADSEPWSVWKSVEYISFKVELFPVCPLYQM